MADFLVKRPFAASGSRGNHGLAEWLRCEGDPQPKVLELREAWLAGCDDETGKSGYGVLPQISGVYSSSLRGKR